MNFKKGLIFRFIGWFFLLNTLLFWVLGASYLKAILSSTSLFQNSIADYSSLVGKFLVLFFALVNYFSFMMLLAFIPAIIVLILVFIWPNIRFIGFVSVALGLISIALLLIDSCVYSMYKFHLNLTLLSFIFSPQWHDIFDFSQAEIHIVTTIFLSIIVVECGIVWLVWKKIVIPERCKIGKTISSFWLGGVLFSYFTLMISIAANNNLFSQQTPNLPLFNQLFAYVIPDKNAEDILLRYSEHHFAQPIFSNEKLNYPRHPLQCKRPEKPYNIILIMVDSLRFDSIQPKYMPSVTKFGGTSWQFLKHFSGGNSTQPGLFSLFYSLPSNYWTAALEQKISPVLMQLLLAYGYNERIIWSSEMKNPPFDQTLYQEVDIKNINEGNVKDVGDSDRHTTQLAINFLTANTSNLPVFLNLFYHAPHGYCRDQSYPAVYQPALKQCVRIAMTNEIDPLPYYNRYLNAVKFVDEEIGRVLQTIEHLGYLQNSVVIITSDHGQEFNENHQNYWEHAGNFTSVQVQIPLIIHWPGEAAHQFNYLTSSYDVVPTLLQRLFSCQNTISDYSIGDSLLNEHRQWPFLLSGSYVNMGIIEPDRLTTLETSGRITITNTKAEPLPFAKPRMNIMSKALSLMREYYE